MRRGRTLFEMRGNDFIISLASPVTRFPRARLYFLVLQKNLKKVLAISNRMWYYSEAVKSGKKLSWY